MVTHVIETAVRDGGVPALLRDSKAPPFAMPRIAPEYSNWIEEQRAWRDAACLYDQSHHMTDLILRGSGVIELLSSVGVHDFTNFPVDTAKQIVMVGSSGHNIGDAIIFRLAEQEFRVVGGPDACDWLHFHAKTRGNGVAVGRDDNSYVRQGDPEYYRYQIQGPKAMEIARAAFEEAPPELKFFHIGTVTIAGARVRALRHGMAGEAGYELFGPWADAETVKQALLAAGAAHGIRLVGGLAYLTNTLESGWIPRPLPAIFDDEPLLNEFRAWQRARGSWDHFLPSLGGSHHSDQVADYYFTPFELGYGHVIRFDHDFIGRAALEQMVADGAHEAKRKVTLIWNADDLTSIVASRFNDETPAKWMSLPMPLYSTFQFDRIEADGRQVGRSAWSGYSANEGAFISLATIEAEHAEPGTQVTVYWGEQAATGKTTAEAHRQVAVRATVAPSPIGAYAREVYRKDA